MPRTYRVVPGGRRTLERESGPSILVERVEFPDLGDRPAEDVLAIVKAHGDTAAAARHYLTIENMGRRRKGLTAKLEALTNG